MLPPIPTDEASLINIKQRLYDLSVLSDEDSCWMWLGNVDRIGYGSIGVKGKNQKVHRVSYQIHTGPIPPGMLVLHRCDNPSCINPYHLFIGTHADNMKDMKTKGRSTRGEKNSTTRLTEHDVREIHSRHSAGERTSAIAKSYGVHRNTIHHLLHGTNWSHIYEEVHPH